MNRIKFPCCSRCKMNYYVGDIHGPKIPLLLKCGHDMCRSCIKFLSKRSPVITCCICEQAHEYKLGNFPVHYYKIGQVFWLSSNKQLAIHRSISNLKMTNYCPSKSSEASYKVCKSCHKSANCFCRQCDELFCHLCFDEIHMESMATSQHIPEMLNKINIQLPPEPKCKQHMKNIEFVCITCQLEVCSVCALDSHRPHDIIQLEIFYSTRLKRLNEYMSKGDLLLGKLKFCRDNFNMKVQAFQNCRTKKKYTSVDEIKHTVSTYMSVVIGALQNKEQSLLDLLDQSEHADLNSMNKIVNQLNGFIDELQKNLMLFEQSIKQKNLSSIVLKNAILDIENMLDTSYSIAKKDKVQPSIQMHDIVFDSIQNCFTINIDTSDTYIFGYSTEFPPDYKINTTICISDDELPKRMSVSSDSTISDRVTSVSPNVVDQVPLPTNTTQDSVAIKLISKNVVEPVIVTAINTPSDFYLQLQANNNILSMVKEELAKYAITKHSSIENFEKNFVVYSVLTSHKSWCRCNIIHSYEEDGQMLYTVHSIDYGFTETVKHDKIRNIPLKVKSIPPLAFNCALYDLKPNIQTGWCNEAYKLFCELMFTKSGTFYVYPMETLGEVIEVDVVWRDMYPLSIRDALFFLGYGSFNFYVNEALHDRLVNLITLPNVVLMQKNETYHITLTHVVSPSEFYLRIVDSSLALLDDIMQQLQQIYKPTEDEMHKSHLLYTPQIGMAVAAKFSIDSAWYRAKIVEIPEPRMVTVFYVDCGNSETLPWDQLRVLDSSLVKISPQALRASLTGLIPAHNGLECSEWSLKANAAMVEIASINHCVAECLEVFVNDVDDNGIHSVTLFNRTMRGEFSINSKLVSMGYALPTESSSYIYNGSAINRRKPHAPNLLRRSYSFDSEDSLKFDGNLPQPQTSSEEYEHETLNKKKSDAPGVEMIVVRVVSPKEIILKAINYNPAKLTERMNKEYIKNNFKKLQKDQWKENDKCAVFIKRFGNWYRGKVTMIDYVNKKVSVYLYDLDETVEYTSTKNLYVLEEKFSKEKCDIIHCSMYKLLPLGTSNGDWPIFSCERLTDELNKYSSVYINKKGREGDIVRVEIWVKDLTKPKALEPLHTRWININKFMVKQGLAMLDKKNNEDDDELSSVFKSSLDNLSFDYNRSSVNSWLLPEPLVKNKILACVTYVNSLCQVYFHNVESDAPQILSTLSTDLNELFAGSSPEPIDMKWADGQMVIAKYHLDNLWYRATILNKEETGHYRVQFIDYGNIETCTHDDLRAALHMTDIPTLCVKGYFDSILPLTKNKVWPTSVLDLIHTQLVEKECNITIDTEYSTEDTYLIKNISTGYVDNYFNYLVSMKKAYYKHIPSSMINFDDYTEFQSDVLTPDHSSSCYYDAHLEKNEDNDKYSTEQTRSNCSLEEEEKANKIKQGFMEFDLIGVTAEGIVTEVLKPNKVIIILNKIDDCNVATAKNNMNMQMQKKCSDLITPSNVSLGTPVCVFYKCLWRRGVVRHVEPTILVNLVDLGITTEVYQKYIRLCPPEFLELPIYSVKCQLAEVTINEHCDETLVIEALSSVLSNVNLRIVAKGKSNDAVVVELYDNKGQLAYQPLIKSELLILP